MSRPLTVALALVAGLTASLVGAACTQPLPSPWPGPQETDLCDAPNDSVQVQYLRAGGFLIVHGRDAVMTPPFYSNPGLLRTGLHLPLHVREERIPGRPLPGGATVHAVLVGHAHYDHLLDLDAVVGKWDLGAVRVYGSQTAANLLKASGSGLTTEPVNDAAGSWDRPGQWYAFPEPPRVARFRVMALRSEHAPQVLGHLLYDGKLAKVPDEPSSASDWLTGETFAWLIDVLADDGSTVMLRIHYQDAASRPPHGFVPRQTLRERSVDLALLCAGGYAGAESYPEALLVDLEPRAVIASHWEDFFRDPEDLKVVPMTDLDAFVSEVNTYAPGRCASSSCVPRPHEVREYRVCNTR